MRSRRSRIDRPLAIILALLLGSGLLVFTSALFGPLARGASHISSVAFNHIVLGVGVGLVALLITTLIDYRLWRRLAPYLFGLALLATAAVFIPQISLSHGGSTSWLNLFGVSVQPSEALKIATIMMGAAYFAAFRARMGESLYALGGFFAILAAPAFLLFLQPDIGTLGVIALSLVALFVAAGARARDLIIVALIGVVLLGILAISKPHIRDRVETFLDPSQGGQEQSWQVQQSLIAIGSGGVTGRGFGQSIQKFTYLPEPMGDSIFAIAGEEFGFIGTVTIVGLFLALALRGFAIATRVSDPFGAYMAVGISAYLSLEAFINMGGVLALFPLTGIPLTFMSQGGSAMLISLFSAGILLNISKHARTR